MNGIEEMVISFDEGVLLNSDPGYLDYLKKVIPGIGNASGVRSGDLKRLISSFLDNVKRSAGAGPGGGELLQLLKRAFDESLSVDSYERKLLAAHIIGEIIGPRCGAGFDRAVPLIDAMVDVVDNWAVCDTLGGILAKRSDVHGEELDAYSLSLSESKGRPWAIRLSAVICIGRLKRGMSTDLVRKIIENSSSSDDYYVRMGNAWLMSYVYIESQGLFHEIMVSGQLDEWTRRKSVRKVIESNRVSKENKDNLRFMYM